MITRKKLVFIVTVILTISFISSIFYINNVSKFKQVDSVNVKTDKIKVIIDAGHGGVDGGAVASDSTLEKDINLDIALKLNEMLQLIGAETILTRSSDISIHSESAKTIRAKKVSDIHNRFSIIENNPDYIFISIHQNSFSDSKYKGAQIFYSPNNSSSVDLARCIQSSLTSQLQPDNSREIKKCTTDVFLVYHSQSTAVLCECGFLSNSNDLINLKNDKYRSKIAFCIFNGILDYYSSFA